MDQDKARTIGGLFAHTIALRALIQLVVPEGSARTKLRDNICDTIEDMYKRGKVTDLGHFALQFALDEAEGLFPNVSPRPKRPPSAPGPG